MDSSDWVEVKLRVGSSCIISYMWERFARLGERLFICLFYWFVCVFLPFLFQGGVAKVRVMGLVCIQDGWLDAETPK